MSMIGNFLQLTPGQLQTLIDDPESVEEFLYPDDDQHPDSIDVDKAWHGIHYLLTGSADEAPPPLGNAVLGGVEIGEDIGYGPARYLTADDVQAVADALRELPTSELAKRYDPAVMQAADVYPSIWDEGDAALEYLLASYESLRESYLAAASQGNAMLIFLN